MQYLSVLVILSYWFGSTGSVVVATNTTTTTVVKVPLCYKDSDCPVINCLVAPCPLNVCKMGQCVAQIPPVKPPTTSAPKKPWTMKPHTAKPRTAKPRTAKPRTKRPIAPIVQPPVKSPISNNTTVIKCGTNTCGVGEYCCNEGCSTCAKIGVLCIQKTCNPPGYCKYDSDCPIPPCAAPMDGITSYCPISKCVKNQCTLQTPQPTKCGKVTCSTDEYCCNESCGTCINKLSKRACILEICNPAVECRFDTDCKSGKICDTKGQCVNPPPIKCGNTTCTDGKYCCNASCNMCAPKGVFCIQKAC